MMRNRSDSRRRNIPAKNYHMPFFLANSAISGVLLAILVGMLVRIITSDLRCIELALVTKTIIQPPPLPYFVHRSVIDEIMSAAITGGRFLMVDGGNYMGKSVAVRAAAALLSHTRPVLWHSCITTSTNGTMDSVMQQLFGLQRIPLVDYFFVARSPAEVVEEVVLSRAPIHPVPVLVVEWAELLPLEELERLVNFAKEMCDAGLGMFIFVFSPSKKLAAVATLGAMSLAHVIPVPDFTRSETLEFLGHFCSPERAAHVYGLLGGHLPHLKVYAVKLYCAGGGGSMDEGGLRDFFTGTVRNKLKALEMHLGCKGCACTVVCAMAEENWGSTILQAAHPFLIQLHLTHVSLLSRGDAIDSPFARNYTQQRCVCPPSALASSPD